jgi:hypothetical protein
MRAVNAVLGVSGLVGAYLLIRYAMQPKIIANNGANSAPGFLSEKNPGAGNTLTGGLDYLDFDFESLFYPWGQSKPVPTKPIETKGGSVMPKGIANNNPLNVEFSASNPWNGQAGSDGRFAIFSTAFYGIRAAARTMKTYRDKYGLNTVAGIVNRWAPPSDNNPTQNYIDFVANKAGVSKNQALNQADYTNVIAFMIHFENGFNPYDLSEISQAVNAGFK